MFHFLGFSILIHFFGTASAAVSEPSTATSAFTTFTTSLSTTTTKAPEIIETVEDLDDYEPCSYSDGNVECYKDPLEKVQQVFKRTSLPRLASVQLTLYNDISDTFIPEDVFGTTEILDIWIKHSTDAAELGFKVHTDAFRSTKSYTEKFTIGIINCTQLDLSFLSGFDKLTKLMFSDIFNIEHCLPSLPPLPRLTTLILSACAGMNELKIFPTLTNGLKNFEFYSNTYFSDTIYNDETVDRVMDWILLSSADTLEELSIFDMELTQVPQKIASFKALSKLSLRYNGISTIKSGAFSFSVPVFELDLSGNLGATVINEIEPGAFQGDFKDAAVDLFNNNLTKFEESVFGPILQQMSSGKGFIIARGNPIDCSEGSICHLAWLKNYQAGVNSSLKLNPVDCSKAVSICEKPWGHPSEGLFFFFKCSNGTLFKDFQPAGFNHCP